MTGRRRHQRYVVSSMVTGILEVLEDAAMESGDGAQFVITVRTAPVVGDQATLHFSDATGTQSIRGRVVESLLHVVKDDVRHKVRLASEDPRSWQQPTLIVFQQELPVQLVNVSRSGCLLQASRPVRVGTVGRLRVELDDTEYADDVRVARCDSGRGAVCQVGVELLWVATTTEPRNVAPSLAMGLRVTGDEPTLMRQLQKET
jgi:hypothetical protein